MGEASDQLRTQMDKHVPMAIKLILRPLFGDLSHGISGRAAMFDSCSLSQSAREEAIENGQAQDRLRLLTKHAGLGACEDCRRVMNESTARPEMSRRCIWIIGRGSRRQTTALRPMAHQRYSCVEAMTKRLPGRSNGN